MLAASAPVALERAVILCGRNLPTPERKAIELLAGEVERRTQLRWPLVHAWPAAGTPVVAIG
ncbi:MAG: hypothetical protein ACKV22_24110, partial [Bryobacteraceae bacterium]